LKYIWQDQTTQGSSDYSSQQQNATHTPQAQATAYASYQQQPAARGSQPHATGYGYADVSKSNADNQQAIAGATDTLQYVVHE
jgi:hypothetical protein